MMKQAEARTQLTGDLDSELSSVHETPYVKPLSDHNVGDIIVEDPSTENPLYDTYNVVMFNKLV